MHGRRLGKDTPAVVKAMQAGSQQLPAALPGAQAAHDFDPDVLEEDLRTLCGDALRRTALSSFGPGPDAWED